ncbi:MAG: DUF5915 domain-containing protein, partial [Alicyclobacillus sp.]|nr:DUF5915 domain-containing protein [Alicyclobacillus sp.]
APESVHLCDFPVADEALIDRTLLAEMDEVLHVVEAGRFLRNESKIKTRQPLSALYVPTAKRGVLEKFAEVLCDELNVKQLVFTELAEIARPELYLNLKEVGRAYGKLVPQLNQAAKQATPALVQQFAETGQVELAGHVISQAAGHAEVRYHAIFPGLVTVSPRGFVGLNTELTPELVEEGYVRELISKMQMMRKEVDYGVTQRVTFAVQADDELWAVLRRHEAAIRQTVLAEPFVLGPMDGDLTKEWDVNGKRVVLTVSGSPAQARVQ